MSKIATLLSRVDMFNVRRLSTLGALGRGMGVVVGTVLGLGAPTVLDAFFLVGLAGAVNEILRLCDFPKLSFTVTVNVLSLPYK